MTNRFGSRDGGAAESRQPILEPERKELFVRLLEEGREEEAVDFLYVQCGGELEAYINRRRDKFPPRTFISSQEIVEKTFERLRKTVSTFDASRCRGPVMRWIIGTAFNVGNEIRENPVRHLARGTDDERGVTLPAEEDALFGKLEAEEVERAVEDAFRATLEGEVGTNVVGRNEVCRGLHMPSRRLRRILAAYFRDYDAPVEKKGKGQMEMAKRLEQFEREVLQAPDNLGVDVRSGAPKAMSLGQFKVVRGRFLEILLERLPGIGMSDERRRMRQSVHRRLARLLGKKRRLEDNADDVPF